MAKHTTVKCSKCKKETQIFTASIDADGPTTWVCNVPTKAGPLCGASNVLDAPKAEASDG